MRLCGIKKWLRLSASVSQRPLSRALFLFLACSCVISLVAQPSILTYHNNNARTGLNVGETTLTLSNVNSAGFGKLFVMSVDGKVDAQTLYVPALSIPGKGKHNVLYVATEHDSVYAFDADDGVMLWHVSLLKAGEAPSDDRGCGQVTPEIGITATPVIDPAASPNGILYAVAMSKDSAGGYHHPIHAVDITTGAEQLGGPVDVRATFPGTGDNTDGTNVVFDAKQYKQRPGLLLLNGIVYTAWGSHCDIRPYTAWVIGYDAASLAQRTVLNLVPNGSEGGIWMSGAGLAADSSGNIFLLDGNGDFGTTLNSSGFPTNGNYGNAFLKLSTSSGLTVADYFEMDNEVQENGSDTDLGSGGALVLPDQTDAMGNAWHLAVGAGKDGNLYLVNRDAMGKFTSGNNNVYQELAGALPGGIWSMPAYFNGSIYYGPVGNPIYTFQFSNAKLSASPAVQTGNSFGYPGVTPSISANNSANGIVWAAENTNPAVLHAYNAANLHELYNSNQATGGRDHFGAGNKYITPTIINGKVYVGTTNGVGAFGLLTQNLLQLHADATEVSGVTNGSVVTPSIAPAGFTGKVVVHGSGSVNFTPAEVGNGVYFLTCCANTNNAYYNFAGTTVGNIFNVNQGQISFYLKSRYSFAQRQASAARPRYAFDVRDGNGTHEFYFLTQISSGYLQFTYRVGGGAQFYYVPKGTEDMLFGSGVTLQVKIAWKGSTAELYLNNALVKSTVYTVPTPNWTAASSFDLGAYEYLTYGGYYVSDEVIDEFTVAALP